MTLTPPETFGIAAFALLMLVLIGLLGSRLNALATRLAALTRVDAKLDLLLRQANIKFDPFASVAPEITQALREGKKIEAIKLYRSASGAGLKESKDFIEEIQRRAGLA
jgi:ribosomal protein L7/L12